MRGWMAWWLVGWMYRGWINNLLVFHMSGGEKSLYFWVFHLYLIQTGNHISDSPLFEISILFLF